MGLPEWCQTHTLKEFMELLEDNTLGTQVPKKGKKMNVELNTPVTEVELTPEQAAQLAELARQLEANGEVLVQTEEQAGAETEANRTVH